MSDIKKPNFMTVVQFVNANPAFTMGGMRSLIFKEHEHKLQEKGVIKRLGKKILIDVDAFFAWIDSQNNHNR